MTREEELKDIRGQLDEVVKKAGRRNTLSAVVFGIVSVFALVSMVYGFSQRTAANKARIFSEMEANECKRRTESAEKKLEVALQDARRAAEKARLDMQKSKGRTKK